MLHPSDSATKAFKKAASSVAALLKDLAKLPGTLLPAEGKGEAESKALAPILARLQRQLTSDLAAPIADLLKMVQHLASDPEYRCVFLGLSRSGASSSSADPVMACLLDVDLSPIGLPISPFHVMCGS